MTQKEARDYLNRMRLLDTSEIERRLSTPERRVQQLDQIWLTAQATGMLTAKPIELTVHDIWARFHRLHMAHAR